MRSCPAGENYRGNCAFCSILCACVKHNSQHCHSDLRHGIRTQEQRIGQNWHTPRILQQGDMQGKCMSDRSRLSASGNSVTNSVLRSDKKKLARPPRRRLKKRLRQREAHWNWASRQRQKLSPPSARTSLELHARRTKKLPRILRPHMKSAEARGSGWRKAQDLTSPSRIQELV